MQTISNPKFQMEVMYNANVIQTQQKSTQTRTIAISIAMIFQMIMTAVYVSIPTGIIFGLSWGRTGKVDPRDTYTK